MRRVIRFLLDALAALVIAGLVLGVTVPLISRYLEPLPRPLLQILVVAVLAACVLAAALRPGGSLRR